MTRPVDVDRELLESVRALIPLIRRYADEAERAREMPDAVIDRFAAAGIFRLLVPRALGGLETDAPTLMQVVEELAAADGSAGWIAMIGALGGVPAGLFPPRTAEGIWSSPDVLIVGPIAPLGTAARVADGYVVSGRWPFASGCRHANWLMAGVVADSPENAAGGAGGIPFDWRLVLFPASSVRIIDTWTVSGLCATGSHDIEVKDVLVPSEHVIPFAGSAAQPGPLYAFPAQSLLAVGVASVALGIGRAAIDELLSLASTKVPTGMATPLAKRPLAQLQVSQAEAALRSAHALMLQTLGEVWTALVDRGRLIPRERALLRLACTNATLSSARAVDLMYTAGGGTANYATSLLQRQFRDIHAVTQHFSTAPPSQELIGRVLIGLSSDHPLL